MEKAEAPAGYSLWRVLWACRAGLAAPLTWGLLPLPSALCSQHQRQGIERLKRKHQPREHRRSWKAVKEAFGGDFSLNWLNPFSGPCHPEPLNDRDWVRQVASMSDTDNTETTERKDSDSVEVTDE